MRFIIFNQIYYLPAFTIDGEVFHTCCKPLQLIFILFNVTQLQLTCQYHNMVVKLAHPAIFFKYIQLLFNRQCHLLSFSISHMLNFLTSLHLHLLLDNKQNYVYIFCQLPVQIIQGSGLERLRLVRVYHTLQLTSSQLQMTILTVVCCSKKDITNISINQ